MQAVDAKVLHPAGRTVEVFHPGQFEPSSHFYPRVLNAQLHPLVRNFLNLGNERIAARYAHLHPEADHGAVRDILAGRPRFFRWGGADLLHVTTTKGNRRVVVLETNSCPSGQKSMPIQDDAVEQAGYKKLLERAFLPMLRRRGIPTGALAVLYDKNEMETRGYAATLADLTGEPVYHVPCFADETEPFHRVVDGVIEARVDDEWIPLRACFRYVTQRPWTRLPPLTRTLVFNPILVCLAGGRNKLLAAKAYDLLNGELRETGLAIRVPDTFWDVAKAEVPVWVSRLGGYAVIKDPYSNAGQGVFTVTNARELEAFMRVEHRYDRFIVQALIGNSQWSSSSAGERFFHVGTVPNKRGQIHVADLRFMVGAAGDGFFPVAMYARRARSPLTSTLDPLVPSWDMLGTNLSVKLEEGGWSTESERLLIMDNRDFARLGLGLDDFVEAYVETILAVTAIDRMAQRLVTQRTRFRRRFFATMNPDDALTSELCT